MAKTAIRVAEIFMVYYYFDEDWQPHPTMMKTMIHHSEGVKQLSR